MDLQQAYAAQAQVATGRGFIEPLSERIKRAGPGGVVPVTAEEFKSLQFAMPPAEHPMRHTWRD